MIDFLLYMMFSGFEFLALFFLIFGFFNMDFKFYKIEIFAGTMISTFFSYILVIFKIQDIIPLPLILIPCIILILVKIFKESLLRSTVISVGGFIVYGLVQYSIAYIFVHFNVISTGDLVEPFSSITYKIQTLCSLIAMFISIYIKLSNGGFGFMLNKHVLSGRYGFLIISVILIFFCAVVSSSFYVYESIGLIIISVVVLTISVLIFFYLSYKRDNVEFNIS
jgi:hypothetical protein